MHPSAATVRSLLLLAGLLAAQATAAATVVEFTAGNVLVSDHGADVIVEYGPSGKFLRTLGAGEPGLDDPWGLVMGPDGLLYVAAAATGDLFRIAGDGTLARTPNDGSLAEPRNLTFGPGGRLYVASRGNDAVVVMSPGLQTQTVLPCPPGHGRPVALGFDRAGRLWVAAEESQSVFTLDLEDGALGDEIALPGVPADLVFQPGTWTMLVAIPTIQQVVRVDVEALQTVGPLQSFFDVSGIALVHDGGLLYAWRSSAKIHRTNVGPLLDGITWGAPGELTDPVDVVPVPWRFRARLSGSGYALGVDGPLATHGSKVKETVEVTVHPGTDQLFIRFAGGGELASATWFGAEVAVLQGGGPAFKVTQPGVGRVGAFRQSGSAADFDADLILNLRQHSPKSEYLQPIVDLAGRLNLSRVAGVHYTAFTGRLAPKKLLNGK